MVSYRDCAILDSMFIRSGGFDSTKCVTGCKNKVCGCKKKDTTCTEGCQCTYCENQVSPREERDELAVIALEEEVHSSGHMDLEERDEFAEFVFAATFDTDSESNIDNHDV